MASRASTTSQRPTSGRTLLITLATLVALGLAAAGIWWGVASAAEGSHPPASALPDTTRMGVVELVTDDLATLRAFYEDAVGLDVLSDSADRVTLGSGDEALLELTQTADRADDDPAQAGLYHSAILYPDEQSLASVLYRIAQTAPMSFSGSADHAVSLAFYFTDPDGNGLELYTDTPESEWVWENGLVQMGSAPLDPNAFIQQHLGAAAADADATMGHVHLRVGDLDTARSFYADVLGFAVTAEANGALFYSAGGYHHHLATNTWSSGGAASRPASLGLGSFTVHVGDDTALLAVADRLTAAGAAFTHEAGVISVDDPWGNTVTLLAG